jgi:periplasmic protein TonB
MLDQLVESKSNARENTRRSEFMIATLVAAVVVVLALWTKDLYAHSFGMDGGDLELSTLVAPPPPEDEPPPPKPEQKTEVKPDVTLRKELIANMDMTPPKVPDKPSVEKMTQKTIPEFGKFAKGDQDYDSKNVSRDPAQVVDGKGLTAGGGNGNGTAATGGDEPPPPPVEKKKEPPKTISGGVLNGKAISLPKPPYPPAARAVRASGTVSVQVLIDESGRVVSASAAGGHPLLIPAAVSAARGARFSPTLLSGQPVKVSGIITYNFVP